MKNLLEPTASTAPVIPIQQRRQKPELRPTSQPNPFHVPYRFYGNAHFAGLRDEGHLDGRNPHHTLTYRTCQLFQPFSTTTAPRGLLDPRCSSHRQPATLPTPMSDLVGFSINGNSVSSSKSKSNPFLILIYNHLVIAPISPLPPGHY